MLQPKSGKKEEMDSQPSWNSSDLFEEGWSLWLSQRRMFLRVQPLIWLFWTLELRPSESTSFTDFSDR